MCDGNSGLAIAADNRPARLFSRQALAIGFDAPFFHCRLQPNSFNGADVGETGGADDEAFGSFSVGVLLFGHGSSVPNGLAFCHVLQVDVEVGRAKRSVPTNPFRRMAPAMVG